MKNKKIISPVGLKGKAIQERMISLMGITPINENEDKSTSVVELTKMGPDNKAYAIVRENHEYFIKTTDKTEGLVKEDFKYIGGLQNKKSKSFPSYAKAIKDLNLKFRSLAEQFNSDMDVNTFEDDNLLSEAGVGGFANMNGSGFKNEGNMEGMDPIAEMVEEDVVEEDVELTETEEAIEEMSNRVEEGADDLVGTGDKPIEIPQDAGNPDDDAYANMNENRLSIERAVEKMDEIIDSLSEGEVKKKVYRIK